MSAMCCHNAIEHLIQMQTARQIVLAGGLFFGFVFHLRSSALSADQIVNVTKSFFTIFFS